MIPRTMANEDPKDRKPRLPSNERIIVDGDAEESWTINWSREGVCLMCDRELEEGEEIRITLPERHAKGVARVIWTKKQPDGCLAGLEFLSLDEKGE